MPPDVRKVGIPPTFFYVVAAAAFLEVSLTLTEIRVIFAEKFAFESSF